MRLCAFGLSLLLCACPEYDHETAFATYLGLDLTAVTPWGRNQMNLPTYTTNRIDNPLREQTQAQAQAHTYTNMNPPTSR